MTRILGVLNYKGGTGKTTTVVNLAAGLAKMGKSVLCIDLDAQGGLATALNIKYTYSITHLLLGQASPVACVTRARDNLDIIASNRTILEVEGELWQLGDRWKARQRLVEKINEVKTYYDYLIFDFSPSVSLLGESGLLCVEELVVPVTMGYLALVGTRQVIDTLKSVGHIPKHSLTLSYVVPTFYRNQRRKDREILALLKRYFGDRVTPPIRENVKLPESPSHGQTIFEYAPNSAGASDYMRLAERVANDGKETR